MNSIEQTMAEIKNEFDFFEDPRDKYILLVDFAKYSSPLKPEFHRDEYKINGCTSQAWVKSIKQVDGTFIFRTDSDAMIVRGLLQILERLFNGRTDREILSFSDQNILNGVGLAGTITVQRTNGFAGAIEKIKQDVKLKKNVH